MLDVFDVDGAVVVRLDHGKVNALDLELLQGITEVYEAHADPAPPMVLTGAGSVFSAGVDLVSIVEGGPDYIASYLPALSRAFLAVLQHPGPTVAAVNGHALAGGCIFTAACDLRVAVADHGTIGVTELFVGVPFPTSALEIMRAAVGTHAAATLVYSGCRLTMAEARDIGLITDLVEDPDRLLDQAVRLATLHRDHGLEAYRFSKAQLQRDVLQRISSRQAQDDPHVQRMWSDTATLDAIRGYVENLKRPS